MSARPGAVSSTRADAECRRVVVARHDIVPPLANRVVEVDVARPELGGGEDTDLVSGEFVRSPHERSDVSTEIERVESVGGRDVGPVPTRERPLARAAHGHHPQLGLMMRGGV